METIPSLICGNCAAFRKRFAGVRCIPSRGPPTRLTGWAVRIREECGVGSGLGAAPRVFLEKGMYWGWAAPLVERGEPEVRHLEHSSDRCLKRFLFLGTSASANDATPVSCPCPSRSPLVVEQRRGMRQTPVCRVSLSILTVRGSFGSLKLGRRDSSDAPNHSSSLPEFSDNSNKLYFRQVWGGGKYEKKKAALCSLTNPRTHRGKKLLKVTQVYQR